MSFFARNASIISLLWVFILFLSSSNNAAFVDQLVVVATNSLDNGSVNLTISCPNVDPSNHLLLPGTYHEWIYSGDIPSTKPPFLCSFQWLGVTHSFNMYDPAKDSDCEECHWYIKENGPCRLHFPNRANVCSPWN